MIVVDTSIWIDALRNRASIEAGVLADLLDAEEVLLPVPVRIELLSGTSKRDRDALRSDLLAIPVAYPSDDTWQMMGKWTDRMVAAGTVIGIGDLLIGAIAHEAGALVWSHDAAFERLRHLGLIDLYEP